MLLRLPTLVALPRLILRHSSSSRLPPFSKSAAFRAPGSRGDRDTPSFVPDFYQSTTFANRRFLSIALSFTALVIYFGWLR